MKIVAKTLYGLEDILAAELEKFGAQKIEKLNRAVAFEGDLALLYRANLASRLALRFLTPVAEFQAHNDRHLYDLVSKIKWDDYLDVDNTFAIDATTNSERFRHSKFAALKTKDAIADWFRAKYGKRPSVNPKEPDVQINLHISNLQVTISLDSSGESLEKRGYRQESNEAPISEVLASGILTFAKYDGTKPLFDAMAGSGTFLIEAALMAKNQAPGITRSFGFERWPNFDPALFNSIKDELIKGEIEPNQPIEGIDIDRSSVFITNRNAKRAGVDDIVKMKKQDFLETESLKDQALIVMNPPYGERLQDEESIMELYHEIGSRLKHHYAGHKVWIISSNLKALKRIGLKPDEKIKLYNGSLECSLQGYTLFDGKKTDQLVN